MIIIRLSRVGKTKQPTYRMVVQDKRRDPWGKSFEIVGTYNPRTKPKTLKLNEASIKAWLAKGASCTATVNNLLIDAKIITGKKMQATQHDKPAKDAAAKSEEKSEAAPAEAPKA